MRKNDARDLGFEAKCSKFYPLKIMSAFHFNIFNSYGVMTSQIQHTFAVPTQGDWSLMG